MAFVTVARADEVPTNRGLRVTIDDIHVGLYRVGDDFYAMEDDCPHAGFPLSQGSQSECIVVCEAHGWPFDIRTGFDPDHADGFPIPCFAIRRVGEEIQVDLETRINDPRRRSKRPD